MSFTQPTCNNTHHVTVVGPRAELHEALLLVEREKFDIDLAGGLVDGRRVPRDFSRKVQYGLGHDRDLVIAVGAGKRKTENWKLCEVSNSVICFGMSGCQSYFCVHPGKQSSFITNFYRFTNYCPPS